MKTLDFGKITNKYLFAFIIALAPIAAHSGSGTGQLGEIQYHWPMPNAVFITLSGTVTRTGQPACATNAGRFTLDLSTQVGKAAYSRLLAMKMSNSTKIISLGGDGTCSNWSDSENINGVGFP